jgi:hypothetical protein
MSKHIGALLLLLVLAACGGGNDTATSPSPTPTPTTPTVTTFSLTGQVTDGATSAAISGATVSIGDGVNSGKSTTTTAAGTYSFSALQQAGFTLNVSATDYVSTSKGVTLTSNQTVSFQLVRAGPRTTFGAGQYLVGTDIAAGRYFSAPSNGCYWERQSGLGGTLGEIIANDFIGFTAAQWIVDIRSSDRAFKTDADCGTWYNAPRQGAQASIPPGVWLVGSQITPGTYRATVQSGCYWERLRDFTGTLSGIIANDFVSSAGSQLVSIAAGDVGFSNDADCGTWTRVSGLTANEIPVASGTPVEGNWYQNRARKAGAIGGARLR